MTNQKHQSTVLDLLDVGEVRPPGDSRPRTDLPWTYGELRDQVRSLMADLRALGIERGDRVAMVVPNGIEAIVCFLAASGAATAAPLNPCLYGGRVQVLHRRHRRQGPDYLRPGGRRGTQSYLRVGDSDYGYIDTRRASQSGPVPGRETATPSKDRRPDDVALVLHTSGTTSRPKRVPLPHGNLAVSARNIVDTYRLTPDDVSLCVMPLFHVHGLVASTLSTFLSGGTIVAPPRFNALNLWQVAQAHNVTWFSAVPSMHQAAASAGEKGGRLSGTRLRGAPVYQVL